MERRRRRPSPAAPASADVSKPAKSKRPGTGGRPASRLAPGEWRNGRRAGLRSRCRVSDVRVDLCSPDHGSGLRGRPQWCACRTKVPFHGPPSPIARYSIRRVICGAVKICPMCPVPAGDRTKVASLATPVRRRNAALPAPRRGADPVPAGAGRGAHLDGSRSHEQLDGRSELDRQCRPRGGRHRHVRRDERQERARSTPRRMWPA